MFFQDPNSFIVIHISPEGGLFCSPVSLLVQVEATVAKGTCFSAVVEILAVDCSAFPLILNHQVVLFDGIYDPH